MLQSFYNIFKSEKTTEYDGEFEVHDLPLRMMGAQTLVIQFNNKPTCFIIGSSCNNNIYKYNPKKYEYELYDVYK